MHYPESPKVSVYVVNLLFFVTIRHVSYIRATQITVLLNKYTWLGIDYSCSMPYANLYWIPAWILQMLMMSLM